jgi:hypothetical protein
MYTLSLVSNQFMSKMLRLFRLHIELMLKWGSYDEKVVLSKKNRRRHLLIHQAITLLSCLLTFLLTSVNTLLMHCLWLQEYMIEYLQRR